MVFLCLWDPKTSVAISLSSILQWDLKGFQSGKQRRWDKSKVNV